MTHIRVEPDEGPPVTILPGGSRVTDEEEAEDMLGLVIERLRVSNRPPNGSRAVSLALTKCEEASHWLLSRSGK